MDLFNSYYQVVHSLLSEDREVKVEVYAVCQS